MKDLFAEQVQAYTMDCILEELDLMGFCTECDKKAKKWLNRLTGQLDSTSFPYLKEGVEKDVLIDFEEGIVKVNSRYADGAQKETTAGIPEWTLRICVSREIFRQDAQRELMTMQPFMWFLYDAIGDIDWERVKYNCGWK